MDGAYFIIMIQNYLKDNLLIIKQMDMGNIYIKMDLKMLVFGKMIHKLELVMK